MRLSIKDITSSPNKKRYVPVSCDITDFSYMGDKFSITQAKPFDVCLSMIGTGKLQIIFDTEVSILASCNRCLSDVTLSIPISVDETVTVAEGKVVTDTDIGPYSFVDDEDIDLDELILSEILVNFPAKILCQDDCKGLCPVCGKNRNIYDCDCDTTVLDPRMAQFLDVFNSFKEV